MCLAGSTDGGLRWRGVHRVVGALPVTLRRGARSSPRARGQDARSAAEVSLGRVTVRALREPMIARGPGRVPEAGRGRAPRGPSREDAVMRRGRRDLGFSALIEQVDRWRRRPEHVRTSVPLELREAVGGEVA